MLPALRELFAALAADDDDDEADVEGLCITFRVPERSNVWVQVNHDSINAAYPRSDEPMEFLRSRSLPMLPGLKLDSWKPALYATWSWSYDSCSVDALAEFIDRLLVALHDLPAETYEIDVENEQF